MSHCHSKLGEAEFAVHRTRTRCCYSLMEGSAGPKSVNRGEALAGREFTWLIERNSTSKRLRRL